MKDEPGKTAGPSFAFSVALFSLTTINYIFILLVHKTSKHEPGSQTAGNCGSAEQEQEPYPGKFIIQILHHRATNRTASEDARVIMLTISTRGTLSFISQYGHKKPSELNIQLHKFCDTWKPLHFDLVDV